MGVIDLPSFIRDNVFRARYGLHSLRGMPKGG